MLKCIRHQMLFFVIVFYCVNSDLILSHLFYKNFGQRFIDYSNNGFDGINGKYTCADPCDVTNTDRGIKLSDSNHQVTIPYENRFGQLLLNYTTFSIALWIKITENSSSKRNILARFISDDTYFSITHDGKFNLEVSRNNPILSQSFDDVTSNSWVFLGLSFENENLKFYLNKTQNSLTLSKTWEEKSRGNFSIGSKTIQNSFKGFVFYLKMKNEALQLIDYVGDKTSDCFHGVCFVDTWEISVVVENYFKILTNFTDITQDSYGNNCTKCKNSCYIFGFNTTCLDCSCKYLSCVLHSGKAACHCNSTTASPTSNDCVCSGNLYYDGFTCQSKSPGTKYCMYSTSNICYLCSDTSLITIENECFCSKSCREQPTCSDCDPSCDRCNPDKCVNCISTNASPSSKNMQECSCNDGFYNTSFIDHIDDCKPCHTSCKTCANSLSCLTCISNLTSYNKTSKLCDCKEGYYLNPEINSSNYCLPCHDSCKTCLDGSRCLTCVDEGVFDESSQFCKCREGYYKNLEINSNNYCLPCHDLCKTCLDDSRCLTCVDEGVFDESSQFCECKEGYYKNPQSKSNNFCLPCDDSCKTCLDDSSCLTCFDEGVLNQSSQLCECKEGYYMNPQFTSNNFCLSCHDSCKSCLDDSSCLTCVDEGFFNQSSHLCECEEGFYLNETTKKCEKCHENCLSCENSTICKVCKSEFSLPHIENECICTENSKLINEKCVCESGYYRNQSESCFECPKYCKDCSFNKNIYCTKCETGTILRSGFCYCSNGDMWNGFECFECGKNCSACENKEKCLKCSSGYYLDLDDLCVDDCGNDFEVKNGFCMIKCGSKCKTCGRRQCEECIENSVLVGKNECECDSGYEGDSKCERVTFSGTVQVISNASFILIFNQSLKNELGQNDFILTCSGKVLKFTLNISLNKQYMFLVPLNSTENCSLSLEVITDVESVSNSILYPKSFKITIESTKDDEISSESSVLIENTEITEQTAQAANATSTAAKVAVTSSAVAAAASTPSSFWTFFNIIEFISFLSLNAVPYPTKLREFIKSLGSNSMIPIPYDSFNLNSGPEPYKEAKIYGLETSLFLSNSIIFLLTFAIFLLIYPILYIKKLIKVKIIEDYLEKKQADYKFNFFIRFWLQSYLSIGIMAAIQIKSWFGYSYEEVNDFVIGNCCFAVIIIALGLASPVVLIVAIKKNQISIENGEERFINRYGSFCEEFKNDRGFLSMQFYSIFTIKRILFIASQVFLNDFLYLQGVLNILGSCIFLLYMMIYFPFKDNITMFSMIFGEICTLLIIIASFFFINNHDQSSIDLLSKIITYSILSMISAQILISLVSLVKSLRSFFQKLRNHNKIDALSTSTMNQQNENFHTIDDSNLKSKGISITILDS